MQFYETLVDYFRRHFNLSPYPTFQMFVNGNTHTQGSSDALNLVYPTTEDVELFPGGEFNSFTAVFMLQAKKLNIC